jgi:nucleoside-diphosphate-sugar epimerase
MKILITGASGFVGTHLTKKFLDEGHTVYALVRTPSKMSHSHAQLKLIKGDLNTSRLNWVEELPADLDGCVHTAGIVHSFIHDEFTQVNVEGTRYLVGELKNRYPSTFKFLLISSLAAAGPVNLGEKKDETSPDFPVSVYGQSKKDAENVLRSLAPKEWTCSIIRPPMIIGPGDVAVLDIFKMVKGRFIILPGSNSKIKEYSFVCVFDLIESISKLFTSNQSMLLYSAHDHVIRFQELIEEIKKQMKISWICYLHVPFLMVKLLSLFLNMAHKIKRHSLRLTPDKINELKAMAWTCDNARSKLELKQSYRFDLKETVAVTLADYEKRGWL